MWNRDSPSTKTTWVEMEKGHLRSQWAHTNRLPEDPVTVSMVYRCRFRYKKHWWVAVELPAFKPASALVLLTAARCAGTSRWSFRWHGDKPSPAAGYTLRCTRASQAALIPRLLLPVGNPRHCHFVGTEMNHFNNVWFGTWLLYLSLALGWRRRFRVLVLLASNSIDFRITYSLPFQNLHRSIQIAWEFCLSEQPQLFRSLRNPEH